MFDRFLVNPPWYLYNGLWRFAASLLILVVGLYVARKVTQAIRQAAAHLLQQKQLQESPIGVLFEPAVALRGSGIFSTFVFALVIFLFIAWAGEVLGITFFSGVLAMFLGYLPSIFSALIVLILGVLLAGVAERTVKQQFRKVASSQAVLAGTIASSFTLVMFVLIALSELGIASEFIMILFAGFVFAFALAAGIALGWGSKDIVSHSLSQMVQEETAQRAKNKPKSSSK